MARRHQHGEQDANLKKSGKGYNTIRKIAIGGAVVGGAAYAFTKFASAWKNGEAKKRKLIDWLPNAVDDSAQGFKQAFAAFSSGYTDFIDHTNETSGLTRVTTAPVQESAATENGTMICGFAYGANNGVQQWFSAQWHETSENSVRVEYLSTMDGEKSSLALPSPKKTTIPKNMVRVDAPPNAFGSPDGDA